MKNWEKKIIEGAQELVDMTNETLDYGFKLEECFPATSYKLISLGHGKYSRMKIEITLD